MQLPTADEITQLPPDGGTEYNRLVFETSPYLLQHCRNPVDWYPWGEEAFQRARAESKPIFLSVGYSTCHWCHVMEHESFENDAVAVVLNTHYICIKVDREERPDIDEIFMNATQLLTGSGGWPNSVWLTPEGQPWYCGTYFPPDDRYGRAGFKSVLLSLAEVWKTRREDVLAQAEKITSEMQRMAEIKTSPAGEELSRELVERSLSQFDDYFDERNGGFGSHPKFPPHGGLALLLHGYERTQDTKLQAMAAKTLEAMARGGIHDHIGGGFHRYSTDAEWFLPHFEKMLYDNAQLARNYAEAYRLTRNDEFKQVAIDTYNWMVREMTGPEGAFYSALDADSEGEEGKFYLWSQSEIMELLGQEKGKVFCSAYNITEQGNYYEEATGRRPGTNIPHLRHSLSELATTFKTDEASLKNDLTESRRILLQHRIQRVWPHLDDKILCSWNGLAIGSLAIGGKILGVSDYIDAASRAADFILTTMRHKGRLYRTYRNGEAKLNAYLDDYAFLADGLLDLHEATHDARWLEEAQDLAAFLHDHFHDPAGGFFFTSDDHEDLLLRTKDPFDRAIPSGNGMAAKVFVRLAQLAENETYRKVAYETLESFQTALANYPRGVESLTMALALYYDSTEQQSASREPLPISNTDFSMYQKPLLIEAFTSRQTIAPGDVFEIAVRVHIDEGWHINSHRPMQDYLIATAIIPGENAGFTLENFNYTAGTLVTFPFSKEALSVYEQSVTFRTRATVAAGTAPGSATLSLSLRTQACNDRRCIAPQTIPISLPLTIASTASEEQRHPDVFNEQ